MLFEDSEIVRKIRDEFQQKFWNIRGIISKNLKKKIFNYFNYTLILFTDSINLDLQLLDMHIYEGKTYVLAGAVNTTQNPQMYYAMSK